MNSKKDFNLIYNTIAATIVSPLPLWVNLTDEQQAKFGIGIIKVMSIVTDEPVASKVNVGKPVIQLEVDNTVVEKTRLTTDRDNPELNRSTNEDGTGMNSVYLVLSNEELAKGFVRPYRDSYSHDNCGKTTTMGWKLSETYAANPKFYGGTFCSFCNAHYPVDQFRWTKDNEVVGS